jgi:predicted DCC family thiol-disulfide oxidoreductase YuxK
VIPVLIHDGDCGFCTRSAAWIARRWPAGRARSIASQQVDDATLAGWGLTRTQVMDAAWWIGAAGVAVRGDRAIGAALRASRGWTHLAGRALDLPVVRSLAPTGYAFVARHRHRLPGSTEACATPSEIV